MPNNTYQSYSSDIAAAASQSEKERTYWLKKFSGEFEKTVIPFDFDYTTSQSDQSEKPLEKGKVKLQFPQDLTKQLLWISNNSDNRLLMILMAGLAALLYKYTGNKDIILGMPIYKQNIEGKFINTVLPLRLIVEKSITFKELLYQVKQTIEDAVQNQNYPMIVLLSELNLDFSDTNFPLFDIDLLLENIQEKSYIQHIHSKMRFRFLRKEQTLESIIEFNPNFYVQEKVDRINTHLMILLKGVLDDVNLPLALINQLSEKEQKRILEVFNDTGKFFPDHTGHPRQKNDTLASLFTNQVIKSPHNIATIDFKSDTKISYRELDLSVNRLEHFLKKYGLTEGTISAIAVENPLNTIIAILAVLKAGGCYLPIDPDYPDDRKRFMILDSYTSIIIGDYFENVLDALIVCGVWKVKLGFDSEYNTTYSGDRG